jgi:hypothetical protein
MIEVLTSGVSVGVHVVRVSLADPLRARGAAIAAAPQGPAHSRMF